MVSSEIPEFDKKVEEKRTELESVRGTGKAEGECEA